MLKSTLLDMTELLNDPALPELATALDDNVMLGLFGTHMLVLGLAWGWKVVKCAVERVYYHPHKRCDILYHLRFRDSNQQERDEWIHGEMFARGEGGKRLKKVKPNAQTHSDVAALQAVPAHSLWQDLNMVLHTFPDDAKLPQLGLVLDTNWVKAQVNANLQGLGFSREWRCEKVDCQKIKYMPSKRCVLRYHILLVNAAGEEQQLHFYSKTSDDAKGRYVFETLQKICASPACTSGVLNIPAPIAYLPEAHTLWQHAWEGTALSTLARQQGWPAVLTPQLLAQIAEMLAALHRTQLPAGSLHSGPRPQSLLQNAEGDLHHIAEFLPEAGERLAPIHASLRAAQPQLETEIPATTIHGTFKIAQILCRADRLGVVDFDSVACGDPLYDVAEFIASLVYLSVSDALPAATREQSTAQFLAHYFERVPWAHEPRLAWYVAVFLLGKIHSSLKRCETLALTNLTEAFALIDIWLAKAAQS